MLRKRDERESRRSIYYFIAVNSMASSSQSDQDNTPRQRMLSMILFLSLLTLLYSLQIGNTAENDELENTKTIRNKAKPSELDSLINNIADLEPADTDKVVDSNDKQNDSSTNEPEPLINNDGTAGTHSDLTPTDADKTGNNIDNPKCDIDCNGLKAGLVEKFGGDISDRKVMLQLATEQRNKLIEKLRKDYGSYYDQIFKDGFEPINKDGDTVEKLRRKLQIKVLTVLTKLQQREDTCRNECRLIDLIELQPPSSPIFESTSTHFTRYVWATGGHSAAAGHGNLFNESYTINLERDVTSIFAAIGIEFEGRNYAMGGTGSGTEISMCYEQIFGSDVDFFSWDYGMTDGRETSLLFHYAYRGATSPGRPAFVGINTNKRDGALKEIEKVGIPTFHRPQSYLDSIYKALPDSGNITEAEIKELPEFVRNFKCNDQIEKGDPFCGSLKYSKGICDHRASQVSWHPGYKHHALDGHMLSLFLSQALLDAIEDLANQESKSSETILQELVSQESDAIEQLRQAELPDLYRGIYRKNDQGFVDPDIDLEMLFRHPSFCHTGRTPAMTRYLGYLTESRKIGGIASYGFEKYDTGIEMKDAANTEARGVMRLTYEYIAKDRQVCDEVPIRPDYKDFFYTNSKDGEVKLTTPNGKEKDAYNYDQSKMKNMVMMFLAGCDWGKCKGQEVREEDIMTRVKLTVNGRPVSNVTNLGFGCMVLKHEDGVYWEPSQNDDYEVGAEVTSTDGDYFRISSIVIY